MIEHRCDHGFLRSKVRCQECEDRTRASLAETIATVERRRQKKAAYARQIRHRNKIQRIREELGLQPEDPLTPRAKRLSRLRFRSVRVATVDDETRAKRIEPIVLEVARAYGLDPVFIRGGHRKHYTHAITRARAEVAERAERELMMSATEVSVALGLNGHAISALSRRAS